MYGLKPLSKSKKLLCPECDRSFITISKLKRYLQYHALFIAPFSMTDIAHDIFEATSCFQKLHVCFKQAGGTYQIPRVDELLAVLKGFKTSRADRALTDVMDRFRSLQLLLLAQG